MSTVSNICSKFFAHNYRNSTLYLHAICYNCAMHSTLISLEIKVYNLNIYTLIRYVIQFRRLGFKHNADEIYPQYSAIDAEARIKVASWIFYCICKHTFQNVFIQSDLFIVATFFWMQFSTFLHIQCSYSCVIFWWFAGPGIVVDLMPVQHRYVN